MAKKFRDLAAPILADPEARVEIAEYKRAMADALALAELREARGLTQIATAERMGTTQPNVSAIERREDVYLSTLNNYVYVAALGGRVELHAIFPMQISCCLLAPQPAEHTEKQFNREGVSQEDHHSAGGLVG